jgi:Fe-S-cluster-containing hydrogenase component 2
MADDAERAPTCPQCEAPLNRRHCKYVCPQHGVVMDCSDVFWTR